MSEIAQTQVPFPMTPDQPTPTATATLKPCAHCGSTPVEHREPAEPLDWFSVRCVNVDCGVQTCGWGLRSSARKAWNTRAKAEGA